MIWSYINNNNMRICDNMRCNFVCDANNDRPTALVADVCNPLAALHRWWPDRMRSATTFCWSHIISTMREDVHRPLIMHIYKCTHAYLVRMKCAAFKLVTMHAGVWPVASIGVDGCALISIASRMQRRMCCCAIYVTFYSDIIQAIVPYENRVATLIHNAFPNFQ